MNMREVSQYPQLDQMGIKLDVIEAYVYQIATEDMHKEGVNSILINKPRRKANEKNSQSNSIYY